MSDFKSVLESINFTNLFYLEKWNCSLALLKRRSMFTFPSDRVEFEFMAHFTKRAFGVSLKNIKFRKSSLNIEIKFEPNMRV